MKKSPTEQLSLLTTSPMTNPRVTARKGLAFLRNRDRNQSKKIGRFNDQLDRESNFKKQQRIAAELHTALVVKAEVQGEIKRREMVICGDWAPKA